MGNLFLEEYVFYNNQTILNIYLHTCKHVCKCVCECVCVRCAMLLRADNQI